jgi:hypothetical protein
MNLKSVEHVFVDQFPDSLHPGRLYISIPYATATHLCCCGCGNAVVTPLTPTDWRLTYDGETVSLFPSIGNWSFECQSHYWIKRNRVEWGQQWSRDEIRAGRDKDRTAKGLYYRALQVKERNEPQTAPAALWLSLWRRISRWRRNT